jgi:hypothetical protein
MLIISPHVNSTTSTQAQAIACTSSSAHVAGHTMAGKLHRYPCTATAVCCSLLSKYFQLFCAAQHAEVAQMQLPYSLCQLGSLEYTLCCTHRHCLHCFLQGDGPYDFMLDSGLTAELITPELRQHLGIKGSKGKVAGLAAGGASAAGDLVRHPAGYTQLVTPTWPLTSL